MTEIPSEADIHCPAEKIFDVIIDFRGPDRWLTKSSAFRGASKISSNPVTLGTTYCEPGPFGARNGEGLQGAAGHLRVVQAGQRHK